MFQWSLWHQVSNRMQHCVAWLIEYIYRLVYFTFPLSTYKIVIVFNENVVDIYCGSLPLWVPLNAARWSTAIGGQTWSKPFWNYPLPLNKMLAQLKIRIPQWFSSVEYGYLHSFILLVYYLRKRFYFQFALCRVAFHFAIYCNVVFLHCIAFHSILYITKLNSLNRILLYCITAWCIAC